MVNLFDEPELTRAEKLKATRKLTTNLTRDAINWLNGTGLFMVHRQNNIPSTRLAKEQDEFEALLIVDGEVTDQIVNVVAEVPVVYHKKSQIQIALLDIAGITLDGKATYTEIEVKFGNDTLSKEQKERIKSVTDAGGISFAFDSMETLKMQIQKYHIEKKLAF